MSKIVLAIDGDDITRGEIARCFAGTEIAVRGAASGSSAIKMIRREVPDLVVTELVLPDITGFALLKLIREDPEIPPLRLMVLTQYREQMERVVAFEAGADDFVAKPYSSNELLARTRAILRRPARVRQSEPEHESRPDALVQNAVEMERFPGLADATRREREIFSELIRRQGRVVTREDLLRLSSSATPCTPRTVDAHIKSLRRKLGADRDCIRTIRGRGYRFDARRVSEFS